MAAVSTQEEPQTGSRWLPLMRASDSTLKYHKWSAASLRPANKTPSDAATLSARARNNEMQLR